MSALIERAYDKQVETSLLNQFENPTEGTLQGRSVVVVEGSKVNDFVAGFDGSAFRGLTLKNFGIALSTVATISATFAVAIATGSVKDSGITFAVGTGFTLFLCAYPAKD